MSLIITNVRHVPALLKVTHHVVVAAEITTSGETTCHPGVVRAQRLDSPRDGYVQQHNEVYMESQCPQPILTLL